MVIIKIPLKEERNFINNYDYIPLCITPEYKYAMVKESNEYEVVDSIPEMSDIIDTTSEGITKYLAYLSNDAISQTIIRLNQELKSSDYKIIKAYEYSLVNKPIEYDIEALHKERQAIRDNINLLESQIKEEKTWDELDNIIIRCK